MGTVTATIRCGDTELGPTVAPVEIEIRRELNRVPEAWLRLPDGDMAQGRFRLSDGPGLVPGAPVSIALRWEGESGARGRDTVLFDGLVVRHAVEAGPRGTMLRIELKDAAFKLTRQRRSAIFRDLRDDEAIATLILDAGLKKGDLAQSAPIHKELVQYYASDWDFIVSRADVHGLAVDCHLGVVSLRQPDPSAEPKRTLAPGLDDLREIELEVDGTELWGGAEALGWDPAARQRRPAGAREPGVRVGNLDPNVIAERLGAAQCQLLHPVPLEQAELAAWADARLMRSRLALLRGRARIAGDATLEPLQTVAISRVGQRFNGKALVSGVVHRVDREGWTTELKLGLSPECFARRPDIAEVLAGGLLPPVTGLQIGKVVGLEGDPAGECRIKVALPAFDDRQGFLWARVLRPDAGKDRGFVFWPEPEDEVVLGFLNGDPRQPVVLGAMHGASQPPPAAVGPPTDTNPRRAIVSRKGAVIAFDDEKLRIEIATPGGQQVLLDDEAKQILVRDAQGNEICLSEQGVSIKSAKDLKIEATGKVTVKGSAVDIQ